MSDLYNQMIKEFEQELDNESNKILKEIQSDTKEILKKSIMQNVYSFYTPKAYERNFYLLNNINSHLDENKGDLYTFIDSNYGYFSVLDGRDVSQYVPYWVNEGHDMSIFNAGYYEGRHYLELAKQLIDSKYNCDCEIINDEP